MVGGPNSIAAHLADFVCLPVAEAQRVGGVVSAALADTLAVTVAATGDSSVSPLTEWAAATTPPGPCFAFGIERWTRPSEAALLNGALAHYLDYDDVSHAMKGHPSAVMIPALLAVAEQHGLTAGDLADAYAVGFQVAVAVAAGMDVAEHYRRGWHATATIGVLGAAAGVGRLLGLARQELTHALGIAACFAGASRQSFGSHAKALQAGRAAQSAVVACELAAHGATADSAQLEGPLGYFHLLAEGCDVDGLTGALHGPPALFGPGGLNVKKHPCCYHAQRAADAALELRRPGIVPERLTVTVEPGGSSALIQHDPQSGLAGKFSGEYIVAASFLDGPPSLATFSTEAVMRPGVRALMERISLVEAEVPPCGGERWISGYAVVDVEWPDGTREPARVDVPRGAAMNPLSPEELEAKVSACLEYGGRADAATPFWRRIERFDTDAPAASLLADLTPERDGEISAIPSEARPTAPPAKTTIQTVER